MPISQYKTGTASISTTEYSLLANSVSLTSNTTAGVYQVFVDFSALSDGDEYNLTIKEKTLSTGSQGNIYLARVEGLQPGPFVTPSLILLNGWDITAQKIAGTDRTLNWSIRSVA
jgi:hypothetical protein